MDKKNIKLYYLKKTGGSRLKHVKTYRTYCRSSKRNSKLISSWLMPTYVLQSGIDKEDLSAVYLSKLKKKDFVVKVQEANTVMVKRELNAIKILSKMKNNNFPRYICNFKCNGDKIKYKKYKTGYIKEFCDGGEDRLHLIVQEYINGGDMSEFVPNLNKKKIINFIQQVVFALVQAFDTYGFIHTDINSGNFVISIDKNLDKIKKYKIRNKNYNINMYNFEPVIIDFGFSMFNKKRDDQLVIESIQSFLYILKNWVKKIYKKKINKLSLDVENMKLHKILELINTNFL